MAAARPEPAYREATYQDVLDAPEHQVAELIAGELVLSPRPALPHAQAGSRVMTDLGGPFARRPGGGSERPGGWWIVYEPELHLGRHVVVPDLAGWRRERLPSIPVAPFLSLPPDWLCEIVSPASMRHDRVRKMRIYAEFGVGHAWIVDPLARTLEVYRLEHGRWSLLAAHEDRDKVRAEPFAAVELDLSEWWIEEAAPAASAPEAPREER